MAIRGALKLVDCLAHYLKVKFGPMYVPKIEIHKDDDVYTANSATYLYVEASELMKRLDYDHRHDIWKQDRALVVFRNSKPLDGIKDVIVSVKQNFNIEILASPDCKFIFGF